MAIAEPLLAQMETNSLEDNLQLLESQPKKGDKTSLARLRLSLAKCPACDDHTIKATVEILTVDGTPGLKEIRTLEISSS